MNWYLRFQRYQDNPRQFSFQNRRLSSNRNLPSPSHVPSVNAKTNYKPSHKKKTMPIMNYSQKKEALKKLLISANLRNSSVSKKGNIKPLASTLLQALKEKRPTLKQTNRPQKFSQHLQESRKDPPNKIIQYKETKPEKKPLFKKPPVTAKIFHDHKPKPTNKPRRVPQRFSPPSSLDSGFTPFFKSSKYFDEDAYFENLTTTEQIETIEETTTITEAPPPQTPEFYQPQRNYGEKYSMQQKQFIKPYYTTFKPKQYSSKPGRYNYSGKQLTTVPSYDGFKDNWDSLDQDFLNFNSQKQISSKLLGLMLSKNKMSWLTIYLQSVLLVTFQTCYLYYV